MPWKSGEQNHHSIKLLIPLALGTLLMLLISQKIPFPYSDLGRHLMNGKLVWTQPELLQKNFYSLSNPGFSVPNHHWGSGVIFEGIRRLSGFEGISLFYSLSLCFLCLFIFSQSVVFSGLVPATFSTLSVLACISCRWEPRPEIFSMLLGALFFFALFNWRQNRIPTCTLFILPLFSILWVNLHIYFFLGPLTVGLFLVELLLSKDSKKDIPLLSSLLLLCLLGSLINPSVWHGAIIPVTILLQYAYPVLENLPAFSLAPTAQWGLMVPFAATGVIFLGLTFIYFRKASQQPGVLPALLLALFHLGFTVFLSRNLGFFGLFVIFPLAHLMSLTQLKKWLKLASYTLAIASFLFSVVFLFPQNLKNVGIGVETEIFKASDFIREHHLQGPVFNVFHNGNYLTYTLFPEIRAFVDSRPEAYPEDFLKNTLIALQADETTWRRQLEQYRFNMLFLSREQSPWFEHFLQARIRDPEWACVFMDPYFLILLRRGGQNEAVIGEFEIRLR